MKFTKTILAFGLAAAATASAAISYSPVTANATEGAQKLYNFLATNYGVKTVSGEEMIFIQCQTLPLGKRMNDLTVL